MPHLNLGVGQHDVTGSGFIIRVDGPEPRAVVHEHKKLHVLLQFGGHVERHEHAWAAALHEITEESGYAPDQLKVLQPKERLQSSADATVLPVPAIFITHQFDNPAHGKEHHHDDLGFAFVVDSAPQDKPQAGESTNIQLLTRQQLIDLPTGRIPGDVRNTFLFIMDHCLTGWEALPTSAFTD